jgi:hypothetical protein
MKCPQRVAVTLLAVMVAGCLGNDVRNAKCTPDDPDITASEDCPYGVGGPKIPEMPCEVLDPNTTLTADWQQVFEIFIDKQRGQCSLAGCHGALETAANGIYLPADDAALFFENMTLTNGTVGRPYVNLDDQNASPDNIQSWIHCNVAGRMGGGFPMPKPAGLSASDAALVEAWVLQGFPGAPMQP